MKLLVPSVIVCALFGTGFTSLFSADDPLEETVSCSGSAKDARLVQEAVDRRKVVTVKGETCLLARPIVFHHSLRFRSSKQSTNFVPAVPMPFLFELVGSDIDLEDVRLTNVRALATVGISVNKDYNNLPMSLTRSYFFGFSSAVQIVRGDSIFIEKSIFQGNALGVDFLNGGVNSNIEDNVIFGGSGLRFSMIKQGAEGVSIARNKLLPGTAGSYCIKIEAALAFTISTNVCDQVFGSDGFIFESNHPVAEVKSERNWIGGGGEDKAPRVGFHVVQTKFPAQNISTSQDTFYGWSVGAIQLTDVKWAERSYVLIDRPSFYFPGLPARRSTIDIDIVASEGCEIIPAGSTRINLHLNGGSKCLPPARL